MPTHRSRDRRVQKTQGLLHGALASLIHEKAYDDIVVKEILDRANVGRSTFYTHFRDKDELLDSGIRDMLRESETISVMRPTGLAERILRFSLPLFEHIERYRSLSAAAVRAQGQPIVHEHLQRLLTDWIVEDLRRAAQRYPERERIVPPALLARYVASTFVVVLDWWLESKEPLPARAVNDLFQALILPVPTEALG